ncbi:hypothetical protein HPP92_018224 [Vanilla planifolia]|uniref:Bulb-type lectin domain-containing protein n=1 Tax=Vanilla planifolia TaxID=51239 RepID=A0A835UKL7_VANPL|nr:hypothetical protein HPP92_018224 [Vanilla planifolia]
MANLAALSSAALVAATILLLLSPASASSYGNVLKSGQILQAGGTLTLNNYKFIMQNDCNLVLYAGEEALWSSRTQGKGSDCRLVLQNNGELYIISGSDKRTVWRSETGGPYGFYALVLQQNGNVVVYGNSVWSTGTLVA